MGNAKVEEALGWSYSGCVLGLVAGVLLWLLLLIVYAPLAQGPGRGLVIVLATAMVVSAVLYGARRRRLR